MTTLTITPAELETWPVLDTDGDHGVKLWLQFEADFLGYRLPVRFPSVPVDHGTVQSDAELVATVPRNRPDGRPWRLTGFSLWSEKTGGLCLFPDGRFNNGGTGVIANNRLTLGRITIAFE